MELASTGRQAAWLRSFSGEIGFPIHEPIPLCSNNQAAIFLKTARTPSRVSLEQGELPTGFSSPAPSPPEELQVVPSPPPELPELELPGVPEFNQQVRVL